MRLFPEPGPSLPPFRSLLVHGSYHPSAPIHMCLSLPPQDKAILISPSRRLLLRSLQNYNDEWMNSNSGTGNVSNSSSRTNIFYPPSPKHLVALLSMLRTHDITTSSVETLAAISAAPTLLVIHEPSTYFLPLNGDNPYTITSYLLLISHALASMEFLSSRGPNSLPTSVVVFDSQIEQLKLPVLQTPKNVPEEPQGFDGSPRTESTVFFASKFFQFVGVFQSCDPSPPAGAKQCIFDLHEIGLDSASNIHWRWWEIPTTQGQHCNNNPTRFVWS